MGDPASILAGIDVVRLFVSLRIGALDSHLAETATLVNHRLAAITGVDELIAASRLQAGHRARLGHNLRTQHLHGRTPTIIAEVSEQWLVRLEEPVGRFSHAERRAFARQLDPEEPTESIRELNDHPVHCRVCPTLPAV